MKKSVVKEKSKEIPAGALRIGKDLNIYEFGAGKWKLSKRNEKKEEDFPNLFLAIKLFKANGRFSELVDKNENKFLKGILYKDGSIKGARINILPDGKKLDGAYSLFSKELTIHDQLNHSHWDVIYKNPNGKFAYHYTLDKKKKAIKHKYKSVEEFEKKYPILEKNVLIALRKEEDYMAMPVYTLLKTYMRIGNEIYYKANGHKGLSTLKKSDVKIIGNLVNFRYLGKDGVPQNITKPFIEVYIRRLKKILAKLKNNDFIFQNKGRNILHENDFKDAFKRYIGEGFYPHIVRSYFATKQAEEFLQKNKKPKKEEVKSFLTYVAEQLGHKKFSKKTEAWEDSYNVTIAHYIKPELADRLRAFYK
jgi:hypothetical protein